MATTTINRLKFGAGLYDEIHIYAGTTLPEGNISAPFGSIMLYTVTGNVTIFQKTTSKDVSTGWVSLRANATTTAKGLVNQATAVPDGSSIDTLLASLRAAGILAT